MADVETGNLEFPDITTGQSHKVVGFNGNIANLLKAAVGLLDFDAAGLSSTQVISRSKSRNGAINISGSKAGTMTLELNADIQQNFWVRDSTSDGNQILFGVTGGSTIALPNNRWVFVRATAAGVVYVGGWQASTEAPALSFAANYQVVAARPLKLRKEGQDPDTVGGLVRLEGAVEETTTNPVAGDTIVTLPALYRPTHAIGATACANPGTSLGNEIVVEIQTSGAIILRALRGWSGTRTNVPIDLSGICFFSGN